MRFVRVVLLAVVILDAAGLAFLLLTNSRVLTPITLPIVSFACTAACFAVVGTLQNRARLRQRESIATDRQHVLDRMR